MCLKWSWTLYSCFIPILKHILQKYSVQIQYMNYSRSRLDFIQFLSRFYPVLWLLEVQPLSTEKARLFHILCLAREVIFAHICLDWQRTHQSSSNDRKHNKEVVFTLYTFIYKCTLFTKSNKLKKSDAHGMTCFSLPARSAVLPHQKKSLSAPRSQRVARHSP